MAEQLGQSFQTWRRTVLRAESGMGSLVAVWRRQSTDSSLNALSKDCASSIFLCDWVSAGGLDGGFCCSDGRWAPHMAEGCSGCICLHTARGCLCGRLRRRHVNLTHGSVCCRGKTTQ
ncbi:hypothetical protein QQF64_028047 [Cirrhinus molitorella]|uniref:Uncharacterized protein n=1 Tax=Cirrhinus molitorella TaxID=172907 RepID=A0ABR3N5X9_9TELE